jgi:hypothetical protein
MKFRTLYQIAEYLNEGSRDHPIGQLQAIRGRRAGNPLFMVNSKAVQARWAYHWGGRTELQFNIGLDENKDFRHGVAFSFGESREYPSDKLMAILRPQVQRFNAFMRAHPRAYRDMELWIWDDAIKKIVHDGKPGPIPLGLLGPEVFAFLGKTQSVRSVDYDRVLKDFDSLLPLYQYVRSKGKIRPVSMPIDKRLLFRGGRPRPKRYSRLLSSSRKQLEEIICIERRHQLLQDQLCAQLRRVYGPESVDWECPTAEGGRIDVVVQRKSNYWFYEIKVAESARACIREAIGQLLEYAFWQDRDAVPRLIVVGEHPLDDSAKAYLTRLKKVFGLPIEYQELKTRKG